MFGSFAALIRYAYREALRLHDSAWAVAARLPLTPAFESVGKYHYPHTVLGANLFRVPNGYAQFADAQTLQRLNTHRISRDVAQALPGDLIFFRQDADHMPYHSMIFVGRSYITHDGAATIVYHTGPPEREIRRVGDERTFTVDVRIITATNRDLKALLDRGSLRQDFYYRIAVFPIEMPPLRERRDDIPLLVEHFIDKFSTLYHRSIRGVSVSAMDRIVSSPWPGNVRQLQNFIEQAMVLSEGEVLGERDLFLGDSPMPRAAGKPALQVEPGLSLREVERRYILTTLERVRGNRTLAAKALGISLRALQYKLKAYAAEADASPQPATHGE